MIITAPVTDYIPASVLTTLNDIVIRGAAVPERIAEIDWHGIHIGENTRDAGGPQIITGVGFRPRMVIFFACDVDFANANFSWGWDNGTLHFCTALVQDASSSELRNDLSIWVRRDGGNSLAGLITAIGADGFTITWTLLTNCSIEYTYLCFA